jgi:fibronectin-binding autotransporter adhesin
MAITYVGKSSSMASGTGDISVGVPSGVQSGDLLLLLVHSCNQSITTPSGWTQITNSPQGTGSAGAAGGVRLGVYTKYAGSSESSVTVTDTGSMTAGIMVAVRGADIDTTAGRVDASATTSMSWSSLTTGAANCLVLLCTALDRDGNGTAEVGAITNANLASITERHDQTVSSGAGGGLHFATATKAGAGSIGSSTATGANSTTHAYLTISLKPAPVVGAATIAGTGTIDAASTIIRSAAASIAGAGSITAAAVRIRSAAATLSGSGAVVGAGIVLSPATVVPAAATLAGAAAVVGNAVRIGSAGANLAGAGSIVGSAIGIRRATAAIVGSGALAGSGLALRKAAASISGAGTIAASARVIRHAPATISGSGTISAAAAVVRKAAAQLAGTGALSGTGTVLGGAATIAAAATVTGSAHLIAAAIAIRQANALLAGAWTTTVAARVRRPMTPGQTRSMIGSVSNDAAVIRGRHAAIGSSGTGADVQESGRSASMESEGRRADTP